MGRLSAGISCSRARPLSRSSAGATPGQVRTITEQALDRKINGGLDRIMAKLDALEEKVDERHAENQHRFGLLQGQLAGRARRV